LNYYPYLFGDGSLFYHLTSARFEPKLNTHTVNYEI